MIEKTSASSRMGIKIANPQFVQGALVRIGLIFVLALSLAATGPYGKQALALDPGGAPSAQDGEPVVIITQVDSEAFPHVVTHVTVSGEDGLPVAGLAANQFSVWEEGAKIPDTSVAVETDNTQSFSMVLALDVSTEPEHLLEIQEAVKTFIDSLRQGDELAIVVFFDEVQVAQDFTGDKSVLNATINALGAGGDYTALNQAILDSARLAGGLDVPFGRRVVVVLTDSRDNVHNISTADVVSQLAELGVPIHTIGFGQKVSSQDLEEIAHMTKGQSFFLASPSELQDRLLQTEALLRQGYKVTFQSGVQADNGEHDLSVGVTHLGEEGRAQGRFEALSSEVMVAVSGVTDGQTLGQGDVINISPQVTARAPIASVEILLDGESLALLEAAPYSFDWNSADVELGTHALSVRAVDSVGNAGHVDVSLDVIAPIVLTASVLHNEVVLGNEVVVQAQVNALASTGVSRVDFLLDGEPLGTDDAPPYVFAFDSGAFTTGDSVVTVRAEDTIGRAAVTDLNVRFLPPPKPSTPEEPSLWRTIAVSAIVSVVLTIALGALIILFRSRRKRFQRAYTLEITNHGNVPSRYELQAHDPSGTFEFEFALGGVGLQQRSIPTPVEVMETPSPDDLAPSGDSTRGIGAPAFAVSTSGPSATVSPGDDAKPERMAGARQAADKAAGAGGALASILSTASRFLPGSAGRSARGAGSRLRRAQSQTSRADRLVGRVAQGRPSPGSVPATAEAISGDDLASVTPVTVSPTPRDDVVSFAHLEPHPVVPPWAMTPFLEPGETLVVDLLVNPLKSYQSQYYPLTLLSRSVEQRDAPLTAEEVSVYIGRPSWFRRLYPYLVVLLVMAITVMLYIAFLSSEGVLD